MQRILRQPKQGWARLAAREFVHRPVLRTISICLLGGIFSFGPTLLAQDATSSGDGLFGVTIRNAALEERFTRTRNEQQPVSKVLMNSDIIGAQTTVTETRLKILPAESGIRFELVNIGDVNSQTTGINRQAIVESAGQQHFEAVKPFWFDGTTFLTKPAHGTIQASQIPQRVTSVVGSRMPLFREVGDRIAWNQVIRRGPQINQAVAADVSRDVFPKVDRLVDEDFARLGQQWKRMQSQAARAFGDNRLKWSAKSSETRLALWAASDTNVAGNTVPQSLRSLQDSEDLAVFVSEEAVSSLLSQYVRGGMTVSDNQLQKLQAALEPGSGDTMEFSLGRMLSALSSLQEEASGTASLFSLEFPKEDPLQVRFAGGDIRVIATFQIHPRIGSASGWMSTSFNLRGKRLSDQNWTMAIRSVDVNATTDEDSAVASDSSRVLDLRIPSSGRDGREIAPANETVENREADPEFEPITTVQAGTAWHTIVKAAAQGLSEKIPQARLPLEFSTGPALPGSPMLRIMRVDSSGGVLRCSFRFR